MNDPTMPVNHRFDHDRSTDWRALEQFAAVMGRHPDLPTVDPDDFMWMGAATFADGRVVHAYKHCDTRRYLHLDEAGHAYRYQATANGGRYLSMETPAAAISHVIESRSRAIS